MTDPKKMNEKFKSSVTADYTAKERESRRTLVAQMKKERAAGRYAVVSGERLFIGKKGEPGEKKFVYDHTTKSLAEVPSGSCVTGKNQTPLAPSLPSTSPSCPAVSSTGTGTLPAAGPRGHRKGPVSSGGKKTAGRRRVSRIRHKNTRTPTDNSTKADETPMDI